MSTAPPTDPWQAYVEATARELRYPPTPDLVSATRQRRRDKYRRPARVVVRRWAWALAAVVVIGGSLLAVPNVRAALGTWLRIGAVEVVLPTPTVASTPPASASPPRATATPSTAPTVTPTPLASILDLAGETSLEAARRQVRFPIKLPTYPPNVRAPDRVYMQQLVGPSVVLVWLDVQHPTKARLSLHIITEDVLGKKFDVPPQLLQATTMNGQPALWVRGPHILQYQHAGISDYGPRRLVDGNVLIWQEGELTYRLETEQPLAEAVRTAESLR